MKQDDPRENNYAAAYLASIIDSSDDAIISTDLNGNITSWNTAAVRIFGYQVDEAIGRHISLILPPDNMEEENFILHKIKQHERIDHFETLRRTKKGNTVHLSITVSPIKNAEGKVIGASKIARDITAIKNAERVSAYLSSIIETSDDAIVSKDLNGFITSWNKAAERIFGYTAEEVIGKHITLIIPADRLHEEDTILKTLKAGERIDHFETVRRHREGHLIPISITVSPIKDMSGKIIGASKIARDISERIQAERIIKESSRKKDEFLANMSHELRTPMNAVIGLSNLLKMMELPEQAKTLVDTLKSSADNLLELINDLLDFAKIESGLLELEEVEFNLQEQIDKAVNLTSVKAREKGLNVSVHYSPALHRHFLGDSLRIRQVVVNLLSNAVKFTEQGNIVLEAAPGDQDSQTSTVVLKVTDTGIGIAEDKLPYIFEKFTQADTSITRKYGGSGLGLAITKAFVEKMGGEIQVESQPGIGSSFTVRIPLKHSVAKAAGSQNGQHAASELTTPKKDVLLVEDYEPNIIVASAMLRQFGYSYDVARNGFEAIRKFMHGQYDLILMDVQMQELDGLEATQRIRKLESEKNLSTIPIIAMTAHVREQDKEKCLEAGMNDFIPKPFDPSLLEAKIAQYLPNESAGKQSVAP
jgi:PAS domain S-box-containing protein